MKVICPRLALAGAFATVSGVVPPRSPKPILSQVKFQAVPGEAILIGLRDGAPLPSVSPSRGGGGAPTVRQQVHEIRVAAGQLLVRLAPGLEPQA
jgi:hypothetical protein